MSDLQQATVPREPISLPAFGLIEPKRLLAANDLFAVVSDKFPVSPGHTLIIPRRAVQRFADLDTHEASSLFQRIRWTQDHLDKTLTSAPDGFNLGCSKSQRLKNRSSRWATPSTITGSQSSWRPILG